MTDEKRRCFCPDDCTCHYPWRPTLCGCKAHDEETETYADRHRGFGSNVKPVRQP